jgi:hypothetical protein
MRVRTWPCRNETVALKKPGKQAFFTGFESLKGLLKWVCVATGAGNPRRTGVRFLAALRPRPDPGHLLRRPRTPR